MREVGEECEESTEWVSERAWSSWMIRGKGRVMGKARSDCEELIAGSGEVEANTAAAADGTAAVDVGMSIVDTSRDERCASTVSSAAHAADSTAYAGGLRLHAELVSHIAYDELGFGLVFLDGFVANGEVTRSFFVF